MKKKLVLKKTASPSSKPKLVLSKKTSEKLPNSSPTGANPSPTIQKSGNESWPSNPSSLDLSKIIHESKNLQTEQKKRGRRSNAEKAALAAAQPSSGASIGGPSLSSAANASAAGTVAPALPLPPPTLEEIEQARMQLESLGNLAAWGFGSERFRYTKEFLDSNQKMAAITLKKFAPKMTSDQMAPWLLLGNVLTYGTMAYLGMRADKVKERAQASENASAANLNANPQVQEADAPGLKVTTPPGEEKPSVSVLGG